MFDWLSLSPILTMAGQPLNVAKIMLLCVSGMADAPRDALGYRSKLAATTNDSNGEKMETKADGVKRLAVLPLLPISPLRGCFLKTLR